MEPRDRLVAAALYAAAAALLLSAAYALGPTSFEPAALAAAAEAAERLRGPGPASSLLAQASGAVQVLPSVLSGAVGGADGPLWRMRLGGALLSALVAPAVYGLALPCGRPIAAAAALAAVATPRWLVEGATVGGDGPLTALLWLGFWVHLRSRRRPDLACLAGLLLAAALSVSWAALLALPVLLLHHAIVRPWSRGLWARGLLGAPLSALAFAALGPLLVWLGRPSLWKFHGPAIRDALVAAASPEILPGLWASAVPLPDTVPRLHTATMLLVALPSLTTLLALAGAALLARSPRPRPEPSLALVCVAVFLLWPLLRPAGLGRFPGRFAVLVPACALLAAHGLRALLDRLPERPPPWTPAALQRTALACWLAWPLASCLLSPSSLGADFSWLSGGPWRAARPGGPPPHDASASGALAAPLDQAAPDASRVYSPEIPAEVWQSLRRHGRLRAALRPVGSPGAADVVVLSGSAPAPDGFRAAASVRREGRLVATLYVR